MGARQSEVIRRCLISLLWLAAVTLVTSARAQNEFAEKGQAERFQDMVVRVLPQPRGGTTAPSSQGFGLIIGQRGPNLIIATPWHVVLDGDFTDRPNIRFHSDMFTDVAGRLFSLNSQQDDLALIEVLAPAGMNPLHVPAVPEKSLADHYVFGIGSGEEWRITPRGGSFDGTDVLTRQMRFGALNTAPGSSGSAIVTAQGLAAMILRTTGADTFALPVARIQELAKGWQRDANLLVPPNYPEMVLIPAGTFTIGVPESESRREDTSTNDNDARPMQTVTIKPFWLGRYPVTRGEYAAFVSDQNYTAGGDYWRNPGFAQTDRDPVVNVILADAEAYVAWLSAKTGSTYRLPSEAEWEYAARAGTTTARVWGDGQEPACRFANVADEAWRKSNEPAAGKNRYFHCDDGYAYTAPVGKFQANDFKVYDMLGNVWQWTADCWHPSYDGAPSDGAKWTTGDCSRRVLRGGSWSTDPGGVRSGFRGRDVPDHRSGDVGFRLARTAP
jgi:formylglycine-generating enzyme required for sulfatase activity